MRWAAINPDYWCLSEHGMVADSRRARIDTRGPIEVMAGLRQPGLTLVKTIDIASGAHRRAIWTLQVYSTMKDAGQTG
jgi:hypothetical protein